MKTILLALTVLAAGFAPGAVKIQMPSTCTNPDGMAVAPDGRLVIAAPNNDRRAPGAIFRLDAPGAAPAFWFAVPVTAPSGFAAPMGICFGPSGELYICDNQPARQGRLLRITFREDRPASCEIIASGLENANGVKYLNGFLYLTQAFQTASTHPEGHAVSALYCFRATDRNVVVSNTSADAQRVYTEYTTNRAVRGGMNGVAVTSGGLVYAGNYGDGRIWKFHQLPDGRLSAPELWATGLVTADGLCVDAAGNLYCADMRGNAAVRYSPAGEKTVCAAGCFTKPSEPCWWRGALYVADYGATTLTRIDR